MDKDQDTRMPLTSLDVTAERTEVLRELFPEVFAEGKVDCEKLKQALGEFADDSPERYGLSWAGKAEAKRAFQSLSSGTLVPLREESVNFDTTENLIIEGDNLEVLKLLQQHYHGKVKMIYIDPPYNTGGDFIYPDDYREGLDGYLRYSGQVTEEGIRIETNTETSGRFHSKWLRMMYPRLFLARNLLGDDGLICVSIDDHELHNLRLLMDEVFGEENFAGVFTWQSKKGGGSDKGGVVNDQEYVVCFCKATENGGLSQVMIESESLDKQDEKGPFRRGRELNKWGANSRREDRPTMYFPIPGPDGQDVYPIRNDGADGCWRWGKKKMLDIATRGDVEFAQRENGTYVVYEKIRTKDPRFKPFRTWLTDVGTTADGSKEVKTLFGGQKVYDFPKPVALLKHLLRVGTVNSDDLVLDFFAGSCTTAQAVMELNREEGTQRQFLCVQLPEPAKQDSEARKAGFGTIADISRERVRRVIKKLNDEDNGKLDLDEAAKQDRGFRALRLTSSNFKLWNPDEAPTDAEGLAKQLRLYADHLLPGRSQEDILYELLLKAGVPLGAKIGKVEVAGRTAFDVSDGLLLICLEDEVTEETLRAMVERKPQQVLCLDNAFKGNDQLKTNTVLEMQSHDIKFHTV